MQVQGHIKQVQGHIKQLGMTTKVGNYQGRMAEPKRVFVGQS